ncbi:MAG: hypothetical protein IKH90_09835, partial [Ruminococcus sp.]|nr:hypothetical protein [Ruminococcus sp.]
MKNYKLFKRILSSFTAIVLAVTFALPLMPMHASADVTDKLSSQNIMLYPDSSDKEKTVSLQGMMPQGASAEAVDVTDEHSGIAAYDITIMDGKKEYQPGESNPIRVEIADPVLKKTSNISLWHIKDNGEREKIESVAVSGGKLSFYATGFSVYEIVSENISSYTHAKEKVSSISEMTGERAADGFLLFYGSSNYFTSALNSNNALIETTNIDDAAIWYFEVSGDCYKIYTFINGDKKYIHTKSGNEIELSSVGDEFTITQINGTTDSFYFMKKGTNKYLQHSNGGGGIRYYDGAGAANNSSIKAYFADTSVIPDDYYKLDGKTYGIIDYQGGPVGNAMVADDGVKNSKLSQLVVRDADNNSRTLYIDQSSDITMWTFENVDKDNYRLTAQAGGEKKYLKVSGNDLVLTSSESEAATLKLFPGSNQNIKLRYENKYITYDSASDKFVLSATEESLYLVEKTTINSTDSITYTANRISVSDGVNASNGKQLILYTRIWDEVNKKYDFYAVDHDGSLKPCYASGDKLMWLDDATNSLLWELTVYEDADGKETGYYELRNTYSGKYLAPQLKGNQILSNKKIGIQMPGRKYEVTEIGGEKLYDIGEYYSSIIAWDKSYYDYAALDGVVTDRENKSGIITASAFASADSFYFATLDNIVSDETSDTLHRVKTVNNEDYGITMKLKNFNKSDTSINSEITDNYFGGNGANKKGLLSDSLNEDGHPTVKYSGNSSQIGKDFGAEFNDADLVNNLFIHSIHESSGYFEYDSCQNFATLYGGENGTATTY